MEFSETDKGILEAYASARKIHANLEPILRFYEAIYRAQVDAKAELGSVIQIMPAATCQERLSAGEILLRFEQLNVESIRFIKLVRAMSYIILENSPGWELPSQPIDTSILNDIAQRWYESGEPVIGNGPPTTLVALAVGFALSSYLQKAAEILTAQVDLTDWRRNVCPICGGKPGFATLSREDGSRSLFCPRCHSQWAYRRTTCPFCENEEGIIYYPCENEVYRLYVCPACSRYIKTLDLRHTQQEPIVPVERILSIGIDLAAQQEGYSHC